MEPRNAGEDPRGAHMQSINQDAEVPLQRWTWDLYEGGTVGWGHLERVDADDATGRWKPCPMQWNQGKRAWWKPSPTKPEPPVCCL